MAGYDPKNKEVHELTERLIQNDVHLCVSSVVGRLLETDSAGANSLTDDYYDAIGNAAVPCNDCVTCIGDEENEPEPESCEDVQYPEVYEWWAVSNELANGLKALGEVVLDDCYGLIVWGRTVTGQSITLDGTIQKVAAALIERTK